MAIDEKEIITIDEVKLWIEQSSIHIKAVTEFGDPVELSLWEAREIAEVLLKFADKIESD